MYVCKLDGDGDDDDDDDDDANSRTKCLVQLNWPATYSDESGSTINWVELVR